MAVSFRTSVFSLVRFRNSAKFANGSLDKEPFFTRLSVIQKRTGKILSVFVWSRRRDSNPRPLGPEPRRYCRFSATSLAGSRTFLSVSPFPQKFTIFGDPSLRLVRSQRACPYHREHTKRTGKIRAGFVWSRRRDSNPRPLGPEPSALPNCATPRFSYAILAQLLYFCNFFLHLL